MSLNHSEPRDSLTHAVIGAAMEVHRHLGPGFLEPVYQEALEIELADRGIPFAPQVELPVFYKGRQLLCHYRADIITHETIILELKALKALTTVEESQLLNYLKATGLERGLLLNFGASSLEFKRFVYSNSRKLGEPQIAQMSQIDVL